MPFLGSPHVPSKSRPHRGQAVSWSGLGREVRGGRRRLAGGLHGGHGAPARPSRWRRIRVTTPEKGESRSTYLTNFFLDTYFQSMLFKERETKFLPSLNAVALCPSVAAPRVCGRSGPRQGTASACGPTAQSCHPPQRRGWVTGPSPDGAGVCVGFAGRGDGRRS